MKPGKFKIYKGKGAAVFSLVLPKVDQTDRITKNGCVMLEVAAINEEKSTSSQRFFKWDEKILFAISLEDICVLFENTNKPSPILHTKPNTTVTKKLEFLPGEGKYEGTIRMILHQYDKSNGSHKFVMVPLSKGEWNVLLRLFNSVAPKMIGW